MDSNQIFLVSDVAPGGNSRCTLVVGSYDHRQAHDALCEAHPERTPVAVVSLAEMEATISKVKRAVQGIDSDFEVMRLGKSRD